MWLPSICSASTNIKEMLQRDPEAQKNAPEVLKNDFDPNQKRSYSTSTRRRAEATELLSQSAGLLATEMIYPDGGFGHKFPLPDVSSISRTGKLRKRYDPVVDQVTKLLMRHGKLSQAQKVSLQSLFQGLGLIVHQH